MSSLLLEDDTPPSTAGKFKTTRYFYTHQRCFRFHSSPSKLTLYCLFFIAIVLFLYRLTPPSGSAPRTPAVGTDGGLPGGPDWQKGVLKSAKPKSGGGIRVLVTGAAGFVGTQVSVALIRRGDGVLGLDNFNHYYDPSLKRAWQKLLERRGIMIIGGDINDTTLLKKLFDTILITHVMHWAAQAGVRYAMQNPKSYVHSNIAGFVNLLEVCKSANPQPIIVWSSSSSVYGLNSKVPFSENDRTDHPASLYAATKKSGEAIALIYSHIYGLSITGLRVFHCIWPVGAARYGVLHIY
uniref:UDP-D-glucuronate 4-epimerase n=1 Tax=Rhizophora mucronata TaxID=61149 RepID=A0A2P2ILX2_RHIMU